jgi:hypothetical protein
MGFKSGSKKGRNQCVNLSVDDIIIENKTLNKQYERVEFLIRNKN